MKITLSALSLIISLSPLYAQQTISELPDPILTPGAIKTSDQDEVCTILNGKTYTHRHRV